MQKRNYDVLNPSKYKKILERKFQFVETSPQFYLLPHLSSVGNMNKFSFTKEYQNKIILFSGKNNIMNELDILKSQIKENVVLLNIVGNKAISIINTYNGGTYYNSNKFMLCLIPREESLGFMNMQYVAKDLQLLQSKKPRLHSNRGKKHNVFFENISSNYVDLGIGACRSMPGLYVRKVNGISKDDIPTLYKYFEFIQNVVSKFLPKCLLKRFNEILNDIRLDDFTKLHHYSSQKILNNENSIPDDNIALAEEVHHNFMPSASFGSNNLLPLHIDEDMFLSIVHVHCLKDICVDIGINSYEFTSDVVKYFTFENGVSVGMRSGDLLVFNPSVPHCVSSCTDKYINESVYCMSHYFKSLVVGRNNNKIAF